MRSLGKRNRTDLTQRRVDKRASNNEDYSGRGVLHRSGHRSQRESEEGPGHGRSGGREELGAYGYADGDAYSGDIDRRGDCGRNLI